MPAGKVVVSESGIEYREQIEELEQVGVDAVLVGEVLMRAPDHRGGGAGADPVRGTDPGLASVVPTMVLHGDRP